MKQRIELIKIYLSLLVVVAGLSAFVAGCAHECFVSPGAVLTVIQK